MVVVGAGGAGLTAAITASDEGANVIILESTSFPGGNSVRSTGGMNAGPTEWRNMNEFGEAAGVEATLKKVANFPDNLKSSGPPTRPIPRATLIPPSSSSSIPLSAAAA